MEVFKTICIVITITCIVIAAILFASSIVISIIKRKKAHENKEK